MMTAGERRGPLPESRGTRKWLGRRSKRVTCRRYLNSAGIFDRILRRLIAVLKDDAAVHVHHAAVSEFGGRVGAPPIDVGRKHPRLSVETVTRARWQHLNVRSVVGI